MFAFFLPICFGLFCGATSQVPPLHEAYLNAVKPGGSLSLSNVRQKWHNWVGNNYLIITNVCTNKKIQASRFLQSHPQPVDDKMLFKFPASVKSMNEICQLLSTTYLSGLWHLKFRTLEILVEVEAGPKRWYPFRIYGTGKGNNYQIHFLDRHGHGHSYQFIVSKLRAQEKTKLPPKTLPSQFDRPKKNLINEIVGSNKRMLDDFFQPTQNIAKWDAPLHRFHHYLMELFLLIGVAENAAPQPDTAQKIYDANQTWAQTAVKDAQAALDLCHDVVKGSSGRFPGISNNYIDKAEEYWGRDWNNDPSWPSALTFLDQLRNGLEIPFQIEKGVKKQRMIMCSNMTGNLIDEQILRKYNPPPSTGATGGSRSTLKGPSGTSDISTANIIGGSRTKRAVCAGGGNIAENTRSAWRQQKGNFPKMKVVLKR